MIQGLLGTIEPAKHMGIVQFLRLRQAISRRALRLNTRSISGEMVADLCIAAAKWSNAHAFMRTSFLVKSASFAAITAAARSHHMASLPLDRSHVAGLSQQAAMVAGLHRYPAGVMNDESNTAPVRLPPQDSKKAYGARTMRK
jgi:hypothetical protein